MLCATALSLAWLGSPPALATPTGTIFSGPTSADAAIVYWNPAGMTLLTGTQGMFFAAASFVRAHYQRDTPDPNSGQPFAQADLAVVKPDLAPFVVTDAGLRRFRFGLGVTLPIVDGANWDTTYGGRPSSTRYHALEGRLAQFMIEPAAAFQVTPWLSVGLGIDIIGMWVVSSCMTDMGARINQMACAGSSGCRIDAPLPREDPFFDAKTDVEGMGWTAGVFGGLLLTPHPSVRLGFSMHSGGGTMKVPVSMKVNIPTPVADWVRQNLPGVQLPELSAEGEVEMGSPLIIKAGALYQATPELELSADMQWVQKSRMSVMLGNVLRTTNALVTSQVLIKSMSDEFQLGARAAYQLRPWLRLALRLEYGPNIRPERFVTPVSLDVHKISLHAGAAWQVSRRIALYLEYGHYFLLGRNIRESNFMPNASPSTPEEEGFDRPSPTGDYWAETDRIGAGMTVHY